MAETIYRKLKDLKKLPNNPRTILDDDFKRLCASVQNNADDFKRLCASVQNNADYFKARPLILSDRTGELVIIAGNQRYEAAKRLKLQEVPTHLIENLTEDREREIIIRDNVANGQWDFDAIANEWSDLPLEDWGLDIKGFTDSDDLTDEFSLKDGDRAPFQQMTFTLADEQANIIQQAIKDAHQLDGYKYEPMMGNENTNGNALYFIVSQWQTQRT